MQFAFVPGIARDAADSDLTGWNDSPEAGEPGIAVFMGSVRQTLVALDFRFG